MSASGVGEEAVKKLLETMSNQILQQVNQAVQQMITALDTKFKELSDTIDQVLMPRLNDLHEAVVVRNEAVFAALRSTQSALDEVKFQMEEIKLRAMLGSGAGDGDGPGGPLGPGMM